MSYPAIVNFPKTILNYLPALPELPENCKKAKVYVEENSQKLFSYLKSDEGKANCRFYTKMTLSAISNARIGYIFGDTRGAIAGGLTPLLFYGTTQCDKEWFNFDNLSSQFKTLIKTIIASKILKICVGAITIGALILTKKIESIDDIKGQEVLQKMIEEHVEKGLKKLVCLKMCAIGPVVEEIAFRGFLTDGIYAMQRKWNATTVNSTTQKVARIALQALVFGTAHYISSHGVSNYLIVPSCTISGLAYGYLMEKTSNIAMPTLFHCASNLLAVSLMMRK